jgi:hypothetical protein
MAFITTADSLTGNVALPALRVTEVQYVVRQVLQEYEINRTESVTGPQSTLVLLRTTTEPRITFFDGKQWIAHWTTNERPMCVRIVVDDTIFVLRS